jgi:transcriptional regulator
MYTAPVFRENDPEVIREFIRQHSFGILVASVDHVPIASHLPFELVEKAIDQYVLQAHVSRANPLWKHLDAEREVLAIFQGARGYISARWYDHMNVPTMNYVSVHAYGKPRLIEDFDEVYQVLKRQVDKQEGGHKQAYTIESLPEQYLRKQMQGIVTFEVSITRMEASFKLSQNRDEANYQNIIQELAKSENPQDQDLQAEMQKVYDGSSQPSTRL